MNNENYYEEEYTGNGFIKIVSIVLLSLQLVGTLGLVLFFYFAKMLPVKYLAAVGGGLSVIWLLQYFFLHRSKYVINGKRIFNSIISICIIGVIAGAFVYLGGFVSMLGAIDVGKEEYDTYTVRVLKSDPANSIEDIKGKAIGVDTIMEANVLKECLNNLSGKLGGMPETTNYTDTDAMVSALMNNKTTAILFDEAVVSSVIENHPTFLNDTKVIYEIKIKAQHNKANSKRDNVDVGKEPFNVLITGMDKAGKISSRGNSDVNILATVNPKTKKILLTTTPRDFYVPLRGDNSKYDKLTHAGNYGVDCSMETISKLYDTPVDFYVKVNFSSVESMVDALGGITVDSDMAFSALTINQGRVSFNKGKNNLNGAAALAFSRERKSLPGGDRARGKHQQMVIKALVDKMTSPALLKNYNKVLNVIKNNTATDLSTEQMTELIKKQIDNPSGWDIESISVDGVGDNKLTYSYKSRKLYVMVPTQSTVDAAKAKIASYMK